MVSATLTLLAALVAGLGLEWVVLVWARRARWLAQPTSRGSHLHPTPTFGGIAIVLLVCGNLLYFAMDGVMVAAYLGAALLVLALLGAWDDVRDLSAGVRLPVQFAAVLLVVSGTAGDSPGWVLALAVFALLWLINLYNFMDGIDGFAAVQGLLFCLGLWLSCDGIAGWIADLIGWVSGATLAFLAFNWPPAKIFMGNVGSGFMGLLLGGIGLQLGTTEQVPWAVLVILLSVFWVDASYTLVARFLTGQVVTQAHRQHLYQIMAQRKGHRWTTLAFAGYGLVWLIPLSAVAAHWPDRWSGHALLVLLAAAPVAVGCWQLGAGCRPAHIIAGER